MHTNKLNDKKYIGITSLKLYDRWRKEGKGYTHCKCFYNAIQKYGWNNFEHSVLVENLSKNEASRLEKAYISYYNSQVPNGYNIDEGGSTGTGCRKSIIAVSKRNTDDRYEFLSIKEAAIYFSCSPSSISKAISRNGTCKGYVFAYKDNIVSGKNDLMKIIKDSKCCTKYIYQYDFFTHKYIGEYISVSQASKITKTNRADISACLNKSVKSANGYIWSYSKIYDFSSYVHKRTPNTKIVPVAQLSLDGKLIKIYETIGEAAKENCLHRSGISNCVHGKYKKCGSYIWKYANDVENDILEDEI